MPEAAGGRVLLDVGKTSVRAEHRRPGAEPARATGPAPALLGGPGGTMRLLDGIAATLARLPAEAREAEAACAGVAGYLAAPPAARDALREALRERFPRARIALTSDLVAAHVGALGGRDGVVLVAGTGAVALGIGAAGAATVADGLGPLLGDEGSGGWIGREGAIAALRAEQRRGPRTALTELAAARLGAPLPELARTLPRAPDAVRRLASFAPAVLDAWTGGDAVATEIAERALRLLATTATAAAAGGLPGDVAAVGGLTSHDAFRAALDAALREALPGATVRTPAGTALDGAARLAERASDGLAGIEQSGGVERALDRLVEVA